MDSRVWFDSGDEGNSHGPASLDLMTGGVAL